jgi:hypothetical protein
VRRLKTFQERARIEQLDAAPCLHATTTELVRVNLLADLIENSRCVMEAKERTRKIEQRYCVDLNRVVCVLVGPRSDPFSWNGPTVRTQKTLRTERNTETHSRHAPGVGKNIVLISLSTTKAYLS